LRRVIGNGTNDTENDTSNDDDEHEESKDTEETQTKREVGHGIARRNGTENHVEEPEEIDDEQEDHHNVEHQKDGLRVHIHAGVANLRKFNVYENDHGRNPEQRQHDQLGQIEGFESLQLRFGANTVEHDDPKEHEQNEEGRQHDLIQEWPNHTVQQDSQGEERIVVTQQTKEQKGDPTLFNGPILPLETSQLDGVQNDHHDRRDQEEEAEPQLELREGGIHHGNRIFDALETLSKTILGRNVKLV